jgi:hypothetical protein
MYTVSILNQYLILGFIAALSTVGLYIIKLLIEAKHPYVDGLYKYTHECIGLYDSPVAEKLTSIRGDNYYSMTNLCKTVSEEDKKLYEKRHKRCLVSIWAFTHICLYIVIGFYCPNLFIQTVLLGIFFEYMEKIHSNCHDALDILFNSIGFGIGYQLNKYIFKYYKSKHTIRNSVFGFAGAIIFIWVVMFFKIKKHQEEIDLKKKHRTH